MIVSNGEGKVNDRESGVSAHNRLIRRVVGLVEENGVRTRFRLVRARADTTFIEARIRWSWLVAHGTILRKDRRKPQLCT